MDKKGTRVRRKLAGSSAAVDAPNKKRLKSAASRPAVRATPPKPHPPGGVTFTHVEKVWFPEGGITKGDVLQYYLAVADKLVPHLRDRPITLERMPDGVGEGKPHFWQKNTPDYYPDWIPRVVLKTEGGKQVNYALVNDVDTLAYLVNQGAITFHPFLSRVGNLDRPDYVLFDLDPGGAKFADVVKIARWLHKWFEDRRLESYAKTSGKSGLHVMVPWREPGDYDAAREWAMSVAHVITTGHGDVATTERPKAEREGRVYIDVIQNARGHHAVPPYVLRPTPQATVSTPLDWKEVTPRLDPGKFTVRTAPKRFASGADPLRSLTG